MTNIEQLRRVVRQHRGDSLGVSFDPELSFAAALVAARRFMTGDHSESALAEWRDVVDELEADRVGGDDPEATAQRLAHRVLVQACEEWMRAGATGTPAEYLTRELVGEQDEAPDRNVIARAASILLTMAWGSAAAMA